MAETGYRVHDDVVLRFEFEPEDNAFGPAGVPDVAGALGVALDPLVEGAQLVMAKLREMAPQKLEVTFGVKVNGAANFVVAKAASEANFSVSLTWEPTAQPA